MTVRTRAELNSDADSTLPNNATGQISPEDVRQRVKDIADSARLAEDVGTSEGTVAAGDDSRITGAAQKSANLSDLADAETARSNLGLAIGTDVQAYDADTAKTDVAQTYSAPQRGSVQSLSVSSGDIDWDLADANIFSVTLTANAELQFPSNASAHVGQQGRIAIKQDGSGGRTFSVASGIEVLGADTLPDILTDPNAITYLAYDVVAAGTLAITLSGVGG